MDGCPRLQWGSERRPLVVGKNVDVLPDGWTFITQHVTHARPSAVQRGNQRANAGGFDVQPRYGFWKQPEQRWREHHMHRVSRPHIRHVSVSTDEI